MKKRANIVIWLISALLVSCLSLMSVGEVKAQASQEPVWSYSTSEEVYDVVISSDGNYIVASDGDNNLYLFSRTSNTPLWSYHNGSGISSIAISSDGSYIVLVDQTGYVRLFSKGSSSPIWNYFVGGWINTVSISSDGNYIAFGKASKVGLLKRTTQELLWNNTNVGDIHSIAISLDGNYIVAGDFQYIYLFSRTSSTPEWSYQFASYSPQYQSFVDISSDGSFLVAGTLEGKLYHFSRGSSTPRWTVQMTHGVNSVAISSDSNYVVAGIGADGSGAVYLYSSWEDGTPRWGYPLDSSTSSVDITSNGSYLVANSLYRGAGTGGGKVYFFSRSSNIPIWSYQTYRSGVSISSSGDYVASVGYKKAYLFGPNTAPTLSSGSVSPTSGTTSTTFTYEVTYTDANGDPPSYVRVYIDGSSHNMSKVSGTYAGGALYHYTTTLSAGSKHTYYFEASDGIDTTRYPTSGSFSGPTVGLQSTSLAITPSSFTLATGQSKTLTATLTFGGSPLVGKTINWSASPGSVYPSSDTTNSSGQVSATYYAPNYVTTATITASFTGDSQYSASSGTASATIQFSVTLTFTKPGGTPLANTAIYYGTSKGQETSYLGTTDSYGRITSTNSALAGQTIYFKSSDGRYTGSTYVSSSGGSVSSSLTEVTAFPWAAVAIVLIVGGMAGGWVLAWKKGLLKPKPVKRKLEKLKPLKPVAAKPAGKFCAHCKLKLPADAEFCPECGRRVKS